MQRMVLAVPKRTHYTLGRYERETEDEHWTLVESSLDLAAIPDPITGIASVTVPPAWMPLTHGVVFGFEQHPSIAATPGRQIVLSGWS